MMTYYTSYSLWFIVMFTVVDCPQKKFGLRLNHSNLQRGKQLTSIFAGVKKYAFSQHAAGVFKNL